MNILPINSFYNFNKFCAKENNTSSANFGLKLSTPLMRDTVSFTGAATYKKAGAKADMINHELAMQVRKRMKKPHDKNKEFLLDNFCDLIDEGKITLLDRIKKEYSIRQKCCSRGWNDEKTIMSKMTDISGFCFVLEDKKAFNEVMNRFIKLIKNHKIRIANPEYIEGLPFEYHVFPSIYKKGKVVESFNSLNPDKLQELKRAIIETYYPSSRISDTIDSISGYSGLHVIIENPDETYSEIKFLTRGMTDVQKIENLLYKIRNGKDIDPKYSYMETILSPFRPVDEFASDLDKKNYEKLIKAISKYTNSVYNFALKHPYEKNITLPRPTDPLIAQYDFNNLKKLMDACEKM